MQAINEIEEIVDIWIQACDSLTRLFWPNNGQNPWIGEPHKAKQATQFKERLREIKNIKNMYKQIASIFGEQDQANIGAIFLPFEGELYNVQYIQILLKLICACAQLVHGNF